MNNIIVHTCIIECDNSDNGVLNCSVNICTCNIKHNKSIINNDNNINIPNSTPFTHNVPPDNDVIMIDNSNDTDHVQFNDKISTIIFNTDAPTHLIANATPCIPY